VIDRESDKTGRLATEMVWMQQHESRCGMLPF